MFHSLFSLIAWAHRAVYYIEDGLTRPKHVALLKNKKDCADVYCVTLIELQAHNQRRDLAPDKQITNRQIPNRFHRIC